jgi:Stress responsive A/B Barrel Domain
MKNPIVLLILFVTFLSSCNVKKEVKVTKGDKVEKSMKADNVMVHTAYFWFKEDATEEQIKAFKKQSESLRDIKEVLALYYGTPSDTNRDIVEKSYDFAIVVHFEDLAAHDRYQPNEIHQNLLNTHRPIWERVMITDIDPH